MGGAFLSSGSVLSSSIVLLESDLFTKGREWARWFFAFSLGFSSWVLGAFPPFGAGTGYLNSSRKVVVRVGFH